MFLNICIVKIRLHKLICKLKTWWLSYITLAIIFVQSGDWNYFWWTWGNKRIAVMFAPTLWLIICIFDRHKILLDTMLFQKLSASLLKQFNGSDIMVILHKNASTFFQRTMSYKVIHSLSGYILAIQFLSVFCCRSVQLINSYIRNNTTNRSALWSETRATEGNNISKAEKLLSSSLCNER